MRERNHEVIFRIIFLSLKESIKYEIFSLVILLHSQSDIISMTISFPGFRHARCSEDGGRRFECLRSSARPLRWHYGARGLCRHHQGALRQSCSHLFPIFRQEQRKSLSHQLCSPCWNSGQMSERGA